MATPPPQIKLDVCVCVCAFPCGFLGNAVVILLYNGTGGQFQSAVFLMRINVHNDPSVL